MNTGSQRHNRFIDVMGGVTQFVQTQYEQRRFLCHAYTRTMVLFTIFNLAAVI